MDDLVDLTLDALAVFRAARLVTKDDLTAEPRDRIVRRAYERQGRDRQAAESMKRMGYAPDTIPGEWARWAAHGDPNPPKLATLVTCYWCAGMWISAGAVLLRWRAPKVWAVLRRLGALSAAAALLAGLDR